MKLKAILVIICTCFLLGITSNSSACIVFRLKDKDGSYLIVRSMEFAFDMNYQSVVVPRNTPFQSPFMKDINGMKWNTKYGCVAVTSMKLTYGAIDGMNEKGPDDKIYKESTQWVTFRDLANKVFYFRTYDNFTLRKIDFGKIDLSEPGIKIYSMYDEQESIIDITDQAEVK